MLGSLLHNYCKRKNIELSVCRERSSLTKSEGILPNNQDNDNNSDNSEYIQPIDKEVYHTRYVGNKKYYDVKKRVFEIYVSNDNVKVIYGNFIEKLSVKEFENYLEKNIKDIKLLKRWTNSNKPKKKMPYVHNKITELGIDYIKSKSGVNLNMKI